MTQLSTQLTKWTSTFGQGFTDRNRLSLEDMDARYVRDYGVSRTDMNREFLGALPHDTRILEVGSNIGNQLLYLQAMGFTDLWGLEAADYALGIARQQTSDINLVKGSAFDLPFKDGFFDLVFTSVVLIHISPTDLPRAIAELHRCTRRYIWGFEYFADEPAGVTYRGLPDMCWKRDFAGAFQAQFPGLRVVKNKLYPYTTDRNVDAMYLLEK